MCNHHFKTVHILIQISTLDKYFKKKSVYYTDHTETATQIQISIITFSNEW